MKKFFLIPLAFSLSFCNCKKAVIEEKKAFSIESVCPQDGVCTIEVLKNKSLVVKTDDFGSTYFQMTDNEETSVIHYQYNRTVEEGLQDGQHREEVLFEINNSATELKLSNSELQSTKMLFGRHCFCKGQAGYFNVENGSLILQKKNDVITFELDFKIYKVPQLFEKVKASVK